MPKKTVFTTLILSLLMVSCLDKKEEKKEEATKDDKAPPLTHIEPPKEPQDYPVRQYKNNFKIINARILTAAGKIIEKGHIHVVDGKIASVGDGEGPRANKVISGEGKVITPGVIDTHSHLGVYPSPGAGVHSHYDGNEMTSNNTAEVWAEHGFWPQDTGIWRALAGGVTTIQVLPGSANLFGGRTYTAKMRRGLSAREMRFPGAPQGLKMACGENPKRVYGSKEKPRTRMGNVAGYRKAFQKAFEYRNKMRKHQRDLDHWRQRMVKANSDPEKMKEIGDPPTMDRDFQSETLALVLDKKIFVHNHCYRADEMNIMMDLAKEFGFTIKSFHHAVEAYKIAPRLAKEDVAVSIWADWWGFKMEAYDGVPQNAAIVQKKNGRVIIHSDSETDLRTLVREATKAVQAGQKIGIEITEDEAIRWVTANAAWALGIEEKTGTLEKGKMADLVVWDRSPFSVYAQAEQVYIDGELEFDRKSEDFKFSDFEVGYRDIGLADGSGFPGYDKRPKPMSLQEVIAGENLAPTAKQSGAFIIRNANVWSRSKILPAHDVAVEAGKIKSIGKGIPNKRKWPEVNAAGKILTPGLIEVESGLGLVEVGAEITSRDRSYSADSFSPDFRVAESFNPLSPRIPIERSEGITHALISATGEFFSGPSYWINTSGSLASIPNPNNIVAMTMGISWWAKKAGGGSRSGLWMKLRQIFSDYDLYKSNRRAYAKAAGSPLSLHTNQLKALEPVLNGRVPLVIHADRAADIMSILRFKRERKKVNIVICGGKEAWLVTEQLRRAGVPVIVKPSKQEISDFDSLRVRDDLPAFLAKAGVNIIIRSGMNRIRQEAGVAMSYGLSRADALKAITETPARVFGAGKNLGSLSTGKRANLVLWSGDPFEVGSYAQRLWISGREQSIMNRQVQLAERYAKKHGLIQ